VLAHPNRFLRQRANQLPVQSARGAVIDVLDARWPCSRPLRSRRSILAPVPLAIDELSQTFFEAEAMHVSAFLLLPEGFCHAAQAHGNQLVMVGSVSISLPFSKVTTTRCNSQGRVDSVIDWRLWIVRWLRILGVEAVFQNRL
jgi:hypothetical protein